MDWLDRDLLLWLNAYSRRSETFDRLVHEVAINDLFKGVLPITVIWCLWFVRREAERVQEVRGRLVAAVGATMLALGFNRAFASWLDKVERPLQDASLGFVPPFGTRTTMFGDLSAFPSDHAVLFAGLAAGVCAVSRGWGVFLALHALVVVFVPRLYLGLHWPTDMLAGTGIGVAFVWLFQWRVLREPLAARLLGWEERRPASFYALMFLASYFLATLFVDITDLASELFGLLGR